MNSMAWPAHVRYKPFTGSAALEHELSAQIAATLSAANASGVHPSLVVSGGRTPVALFAKLSHADIAWHKVIITLADERWVDTTDSASNEKLVRDVLLQHNAAAARFVGLKTPHDSPEAGLMAIEAQLAGIPQPFTLVLLGMGEDGHVASLFPDAPQLNAAMQSSRRCHAMRPASTEQPRVSLTASAILNSQQIVIYIAGEKKLAVMRAALSGDDVTLLPVRFLLQQQRVPVTVYWSPG